MRKENRARLSLELCKGRHDIAEAVDGAIFPTEIKDVTDTENLERKAFNGIWNAAFKHFASGEAGYAYTPYVDDSTGDETYMVPVKMKKGLEVNIYATGLTVALIAALNVCKEEGLEAVVWHYNKETGNYFPQRVV